ncbi:MAG TPA: hypothetical protein VLF19_07575 [Methylomirabilota bacterium]|nr:hypothetical protein [Methylomirabilota bacterium]
MITRRRAGLVLASVVLAVVGSGTSAGQADLRQVEIRVTERHGVIKFQFYRQEHPGTSAMVPAKAHRLMVLRADESPASWMIEAPRDGGALEVTYGDLPEGFRQGIPNDDFAPPLEPHTTYVVSVIFVAGYGSTTFRYSGR